MTYKLFMTYLPITHKLIHNSDRQKYEAIFVVCETSLPPQVPNRAK